MDALAANLRRLRKQAKLTQSELADQSGVPRATLASMEQEGSNPSMATVVAVAKALAVSLDELLHPSPEHRHYLVTAREQQTYRADGGRFLATRVSPIASRGVEINALTLLAGCRSIGRPHPLGAQEFFHCLVGTSVVQIEDEPVTVQAGCLIQFPGHRKHIYINPGKATAQAMSVVVFRMG